MQAAPFFDDIADGPAGGSTHWVETDDGVRLRVGHWTNRRVTGTVLLLPGRTEYIEKYGPAAREFLHAGLATVAIDWRGQGLADRHPDTPALGYVADFADYQLDVQAVLAHVRALGLPEPFYLLGHSMGGCIGLRSLIAGIDVKAAMFSAPMWGIGLAPYLRPLAWMVSSGARALGRDAVFAPQQVAETYVLRCTFEDNELTNDPAMFAFMQNQLSAHPDLALGGVSLRWLNAALRETRKLALAAAPQTPCLTFLGSDETIVDPARIHKKMAQWADGQLVIIPQGRHEVMMDTPAVQSQVFAQTIAHFKAHA